MIEFDNQKIIVDEKTGLVVNDSSIKIAFSSKFMMDAIKTFESEEIKLSFTIS